MLIGKASSQYYNRYNGHGEIIQWREKRKLADL
jgi:hypothetical protein